MNPNLESEATRNLDQLGQALQGISEKLESLNVGVEAWVKAEFAEDTLGEGPIRSLGLGFTICENRWQLVVEIPRGYRLNETAPYLTREKGKPSFSQPIDAVVRSDR